ncbi:MAG TPA: hypothetical protein VMI54_00580 [Polyangiaceae bacterium]|nr:hypothetical protein [Polyangiaceae bacterium]
MATRALALGAALVALTACGSPSHDHEQPTKAAQTGTQTDVLDQVLSDCTDFGTRLCAAAAPCCAQATSAPLDQDACVETYVEHVCMPSAELVAAGLATYDGSSADACLAAHQASYDTCLADWDETVAIRRELWASCRVIDGTTPEGRDCDDDARCALPDGDATAACIGGVCQKIELLAEGDACPYPNGDVSTCDLGLYCTANEPGEVGTCVQATPEGSMCDPSSSNMECGLGSFCDVVDGVCKKATNFGGPSCTEDAECVSFICDKATQTCRAPLSTAASLCGGT